uniref:Uncharacterized protein n=1 Tax=Glossina palpalis gambiensis TaxID=67801 RepID=A0A1B0BJA7_9MUSC
MASSYFAELHMPILFQSYVTYAVVESAIAASKYSILFQGLLKTDYIAQAQRVSIIALNISNSILIKFLNGKYWSKERLHQLVQYDCSNSEMKNAEGWLRHIYLPSIYLSNISVEEGNELLKPESKFMLHRALFLLILTSRS